MFGFLGAPLKMFQTKLKLKPRACRGSSFDQNSTRGSPRKKIDKNYIRGSCCLQRESSRKHFRGGPKMMRKLLLWARKIAEPFRGATSKTKFYFTAHIRPLRGI